MDKIDSYSNIVPQDLIFNKLPSDVFKKILCCLSGPGLRSAALVNKYWNQYIAEAARLDAYHHRNDFIQFMLDHIKEIPQKVALVELGDDRNILRLNSLKEIKLETEEMVERLLGILTCIKKPELERLRWQYKIKAGMDYDNLLPVAELHKDLDVVNASNNRLFRVHKLQRIAMLLTVYRHTQKAIEVANLIPDEYEKALTIQGISDAMMQRGKWENAIRIANMIHKDYFRIETLSIISKRLLKKGSIERAIDVAKMMPDYIYKSGALSLIGDHYLNEGNIPRAIEIYQSLPYSLHKYSGLEAAGTKLAQSGRIEAAVDAIHLIDDEKAQQQAIQRVYLSLRPSSAFGRF